MSTQQLEQAVGYLRKLATAGQDAGADADLLTRFIQTQDEAAFAGLVDRHGAMVLGVCSRVLRHQQDAEDAFQATFLVLARQARTVRKREALGNWLHGVAFRVANKLRVRQARRETVEKNTARPAAADTGDDITWREMRSILDGELLRLPGHLRAPLVLCYLEGKTRDEAAGELGWSLATFRGRLERGRHQLRRRLARRGLALTAPLLAAMLPQQAAAAVPPALLTVQAVRNSLHFASAGQIGLVPGPLATLAQEVMLPMFLLNFKALLATVAAALIAVFLARGISVQNTEVPAEEFQAVTGEKPAQPNVSPNEQAKEKPVEPDPLKQEIQKLLPPSVIVLTQADDGRIVHAQLGQLIVVCLKYPEPKKEALIVAGGYASSMSQGKCATYILPSDPERGKKIETMHKKLIGHLSKEERWCLAWFEATLPGQDELGVVAIDKGSGRRNDLEVSLNVGSPFQSVEVERFFRSVNVTWKKTEKIEIKDQNRIAELMAFFPELWSGKKSDLSEMGFWSTRFQIRFIGKDAKPIAITVSPDAKFWSNGKSDWAAEPNLRMFLAELFKDTAELDLIKLQGVWRLVAQDGKAVNGVVETFQLGIRETIITVKNGSDFPVKFSLDYQKGISFLDPAKKPKQISVVQELLDGKTVLVPGIYAFDEKESTLRFCWGNAGGPFPKDFQAGPNQTVQIFTNNPIKPPASPPADPAVLKKLQGTWRVVHFEAAGIKGTLTPTTTKPWQLVLDGGMLREVNGKAFTGGADLGFHVDTKSKPFAITFTHLEQTEKMPPIQGIFKLETTKEGDTLTICTGHPRPTDFVTAGHPGRAILVAVREQTKAKAPEQPKPPAPAADPALLKKLQGTWRVIDADVAVTKKLTAALQKEIDGIKASIAEMSNKCKRYVAEIAKESDSTTLKELDGQKARAEHIASESLQQLQGVLLSANTVPARPSALGPVWGLNIQDDMVSTIAKGKVPVVNRKFTIDSGKTPHAITFSHLLSDDQFPPLEGIFNLETTNDGDILTLCTGAPRPTAFATKDQPGSILLKLVRVESKADGPKDPPPPKPGGQ